MRVAVVKMLMTILFVGGLFGLFVASRGFTCAVGEIPVGDAWLVWATVPVGLLTAWLAIPWLVRMHGGPAALDEDMQRDADRMRGPREGMPRPSMAGGIAWLTALALDAGLKATSPRRRYAHLAVLLFPSLVLLSWMLAEHANAAFAGGTPLHQLWRPTESAVGSSPTQSPRSAGGQLTQG
jgi:hypothetical protein